MKKGKPKKKKKDYVKPKVKTENLELFGGGGGGGPTCNGSTSGGRKATDLAPDLCDPAKLKT